MMGTKTAPLKIFLVFLVVINIPEHSATTCKYKAIEPSPSYDGYITSPGYPTTYSSDSCIIWVYYGWPGLQVTIRFLDLDIPSFSDACSYDQLRIGPLNEHTYCNSIDSQNVEPYTAEFNSSNYWLYIVFNSTEFGTKGRGFKIEFQFWDVSGMPSLTTTTTMATTASAFLFSTEGYKSNDEHLCNVFLTNDTGYIKTDEKVLECLMTTGKATWQIYYPSIDSIHFKCQIMFDKCNVPYPDKLTIYDGYVNEDSILGEYSEGLCPNFLISTTNSLVLEYTRKAAATLPSLKLLFMKIQANSGERIPTYDTTKTSQYGSTSTPSYRYIPSQNPFDHYSNECAFHLSNDSGEINSADIASLIQRSGFCTWLLNFDATDGQIVTYTLNFEKFHLAAESTFVVYDGFDMTAPVLGSYLPLAPHLSLRSSQSSVFIYFNPGINVNFVGVSDVFSFKYQANIRCSDYYLPCGYEELACYRNNQRCDNIWDCPLHGGDERGCFFECPQEFSCGFTTTVCYSESERCNGKSFCENNMDELNCNKARCSPDKGLFLCRSGHCIYENLRCNDLNDCMDNSDEANCPAFLTRRIIIAAVGASLVCALMVVMSMGCVCKVYRMRTRRHHESQHYETPLSQHLSEMLRQRAPPPPYHEAMLTSRPYSEANLELLGYTEQQEGSGRLNPGYHDDVVPAVSNEQTQRSHDNEHIVEDQNLNENHQVSVFRNVPGTVIEVGTLALFSDSVRNDNPYWHTDGHDLHTDDSDLPPYSETDPSGIRESHPNVLRGEDSWQRSFERGVDTSDNSHARSARDLLIQMEMLPSDGARHSAIAQTAASVAGISDGLKSVSGRQHMKLANDGSRHTERSTSSGLFIDSSGDKEVKDDENYEMRDNVDVIDDDSDSECILAEDHASDDNSESDTCILAHE